MAIQWNITRVGSGATAAGQISAVAGHLDTVTTLAANRAMVVFLGLA